MTDYKQMSPSSATSAATSKTATADAKEETGFSFAKLIGGLAVVALIGVAIYIVGSLVVVLLFIDAVGELAKPAAEISRELGITDFFRSIAGR